ncbi:hypothetical protein ALT785_150040 [Alteromonas infernus]
MGIFKSILSDDFTLGLFVVSSLGADTVRVGSFTVNLSSIARSTPGIPTLYITVRQSAEPPLQEKCRRKKR